MRTLITTALLAAVALPTLAQAQSDQDYRRDRREIQQDRRDVRDDRANDDGDRYHRDRQELREDRRDYRDDRDRAWGRDDWRGWREQHRDVYARGGWRAPFGYYAFRPGARIAPAYFGSRFVIADPWRYHLPRPRPYTNWVRHYDDVLLVDYRRGVVVDVIRSFYS